MKHRVAAGGLVERVMPDGVKLVIVRRTRYGDWVLPKGKPDGDETLEQTALREVKEETGCEARIVGGSYTIEYNVRRVRKVVTFYQMAFVADGFDVDPWEIAQVMWMSPSEALARLTYNTEREIVRSAYPPAAVGAASTPELPSR
jgi:8-oxo-dGTP diphosphatase